MTKDDITRMAREAGFVGFDGETKSLREFAALVKTYLEEQARMNWLPAHKCGLHLSHNEHKDFYLSIQDHYDAKNFVSPEEYVKAIDENSVWVLQWYPETPLGFHIICASSLQAIEDALKEKNDS